MLTLKGLIIVIVIITVVVWLVISNDAPANTEQNSKKVSQPSHKKEPCISEAEEGDTPHYDNWDKSKVKEKPVKKIYEVTPNGFKIERLKLADGLITHEPESSSMIGVHSAFYASPSLLTEVEQKFYHFLRKRINSKGFSVTYKVRIADLMEVKDRVPNDHYGKLKYSYNAKIQRKHVDFVICDPKNMAIVCAIELNDKSHNRHDRKERDREVREFFVMAGIPLYEITQATYYPENIFDELTKHFSSKYIATT